MPHIDSFFASNYIKGAELEGQPPLQLTIKGVQLETLSSDQRGKDEPKPILYFNETPKGMVLNRTNADVIMGAYGPNTDNWTDRRVDVYHDPNVYYGREKVGGLRVTVPRQETRETVQPRPLGHHGVVPPQQVHRGADNMPGPGDWKRPNPSRALVDRVAGEDRDRDAPPPREEDYGRAGPR